MKEKSEVDLGGRPPVVFSEEQIRQVKTLASVLSKGQLANYFGICENTFREVESRQKEVSEAYKIGRASAIATVATGLVAQARSGNTAAAIFYLKTQAGWATNDKIEINKKEIPASKDEMINEIQNIASREGLSIEDFCDREGIEL